MTDQTRQFLSPPSIRHPNVKRSTSFGGTRLHFDYTGRDNKIRPSPPDSSHQRLPPSLNATPPLVRQSTVDILLPIAVPTVPTSSFSPRISYEEFNPKNTTSTIRSITPNINLTALKHSEQPSNSQIPHPKKDVTLATSSSWRVPKPPVQTEATTIDYSLQPSMSKNYDTPLYSFNSNHDNRRSPQPPHNPVLPVLSLIHKPAAEPSVVPATSPILNTQVEKHQESNPALITPSPPQFELTSSRATHLAATSGPLPKPLSLSSQLGLNLSERSKTLTIGYTPQQRQQIEEAQNNFAETMRRQEAETKAKLEAQKKAEEAAEKLEAEKKADEDEEEAAKLSKEAHQLTLADDDDDVNHFRQCLDTRIKESRDSKNLEGALAGRQNTQNPAETAENLTNASKNKVEKSDSEGHAVENQGSTQSGADSSEEYTLIDILKNMKTFRNANRKKYAEHYYDFDDDDSELHSLNSVNSMLSTVTEEELLDSTSLNNMPAQLSDHQDSQVNHLQPRVIYYIDKLVDDIFSSVRPSDVLVKPASFLLDDLYVIDDPISSISENAKQFFTPRNSAEVEGSDIDETTKF